MTTQHQIALRCVVVALAAVFFTAGWSHATETLCPGHLETLRTGGPGIISTIDSDGSIAVTVDSVGISTWDVSDRAQPRLMGSHAYQRGIGPRYGQDLIVLMSPDRALKLPEFEWIDLSDPHRPQPERRLDEAATYQCQSQNRASCGIAVSPNLIAAMYGFFEVWFLDPADPEGDSWIKVYRPDLFVVNADLDFADEFLVTATFFGNVSVFDVRNPAEPQLLGSVSLDVTDGEGAVFGGQEVAVAVYPEHNAISAVYSADLSDPSTPLAHDITDFLEWERVIDA